MSAIVKEVRSKVETAKVDDNGWGREVENGINQGVSRLEWERWLV